MFRIHSSHQRRPDVLRKLHQQRIDLLQGPGRLLAQFDCGNLFSDREEGGELQRLLGGADFGAVVGDVGGELRRNEGQYERGREGIGETDLDNCASDRGRVVGESLEALRVFLREGGGRSAEVVEAPKEFPDQEKVSSGRMVDCKRRRTW
jgi:hypothetical protein